MQNEEVSVNGVHVAGNFQSWDPAASEMIDTNGDGKYEIDFTFVPGEELQYKFINGNDWDSAETVPDECVTEGNRTLVAPIFNRPYEVCYETCEACPAPPVTKAVIFSVDITSWLDEEGATGLPIFSVARGDQMQTRGGFNGWNCDDPADCEMTRTPGTNLFSLAVTVTDQPDHDFEYKFFLQLDSTSIVLLEAEYGPIYADIGWEDSPQIGGANRIFQLGEDDGTGLLELPLAGYYDLPPNAVVPDDQEISLTFSVDMTDAAVEGFNADEDIAYVVLKDKWLNYLQGFGDNSTHNATANGDGTYSATIDFTGPVAWHMVYIWGFYDVSDNADIQEGGGFAFGRFRARYFHADADNDCAWGDYVFPMDEFQRDPPMPIEDYDPESTCISLMSVDDGVIPMDFYISENYPNPFNPTTSIDFGIPSDLNVQINIYNIIGQQVASIDQGLLSPGSYTVTWNGKDTFGNFIPSGVYFYEIKAGEQFQKIKKMTLLK